MKQTIAEQKASEPQKRPARKGLLPWGCCGVLAVMAFFFKYVFPGYSFSVLVCLTLIGIILFYTLMPTLGEVLPGLARWLTRIVTAILIVGVVIYAGTEALIIHASFGTPEKDVDYVVVLGAKVRPDGPSVSLQNRIDAAYAYLEAHPNVIAVVSGGQGTDEVMTEAACMYQQLTEMGIDPNRVWMEPEATSTWENLQYSLNLIQEKTGARPEVLGVVSSEYHLFRASLFAKKCGVEFAGIPAHTTNPAQMVNHFLREVAGVWHYILLGGTYHD